MDLKRQKYLLFVYFSVLAYSCNQPNNQKELHPPIAGVMSSMTNTEIFSESEQTTNDSNVAGTNHAIDSNTLMDSEPSVAGMMNMSEDNVTNMVTDTLPMDAGSNDDLSSEDQGPSSDPLLNGSEGCGSETIMNSGVYQINVDGTERTYHIVLPETYESNT